jgi:hypothetical protein
MNADIEPWSRVWITSIACAVLKNAGLPEVLDVSPRFNRLLRNAQLRSVLDHFVVLLDYSPRDVHHCAQETNTVLIGDVDLAALLAMIPANVLTREVVDMLAGRYDEMPGHQSGATGLEAFAALFETGLLGLVQTNPLSGEQVQHFLTPGEYAFGSVRALPWSHHYLVRSVLSGYISALNASYADRTDRANVIGNGRPWRDPELGRAQHDRPAAYVGEGPYVHVCYAHDDAASVFGDIAWLTRQGINVWYDEGIPAGSRWSDELAARIRHASLFLFFASPASVRSNHCINEGNFVADLHTPFVAVQIQENAAAGRHEADDRREADDSRFWLRDRELPPSDARCAADAPRALTVDRSGRRAYN